MSRVISNNLILAFSLSIETVLKCDKIFYLKLENRQSYNIRKLAINELF